MRANNTSGVEGVYWSSDTKRWKANILLNGRRLHLGCFKEKEDAIATRKKAEEKSFEEIQRARLQRTKLEKKKRNTNRIYSNGYYEQNRERLLAATKRWRENNPEKVRDCHKKNLKNQRQKEPIKIILREIKCRAKRNCLEFDLEPSDLQIPETCPVLGIPIGPFRGAFKPDNASVDRIDPSKGYVKGNVKIISLEANVLKRDCTDPQKFRAIADYIERNLVN